VGTWTGSGVVWARNATVNARIAKLAHTSPFERVIRKIIPNGR
jgi:hypothetical protein